MEKIKAEIIVAERFDLVKVIQYDIRPLKGYVDLPIHNIAYTLYFNWLSKRWFYRRAYTGDGCAYMEPAQVRRFMSEFEFTRVKRFT